MGMGALRHGHSAGGKCTPEYYTWCGMIQRTTNPNNPSYKNYGGRGITVCERWRSYDNFIADMGVKPSEGYWSLDRIDNNGHYEPGNCRWATRKQQNDNKRLYKLQPRHLRQIQDLVWMGYGIRQVARMYDVGHRCVRLIVAGQYACQKKESDGLVQH